MSNPTKPNLLADRTDTVSAEDWQLQLVQSLTKEVFRLTEEQGITYGEEFAELARLNIVAGMVSSTVFAVLSRLPRPRPGQSASDAHHKSYREIREAIENAVSSGFQAAVKSWGGLDKEYLCSIQIVPEPANKESC